MKTKCYSVRLESLVSISDKAYKAKSFDGREDILPKSQVFGRDESVSKSDAFWIAAWILEQKSIQYSRKKVGWFNKSTGEIEAHAQVIRHIPDPVTPTKTTPPDELTR